MHDIDVDCGPISYRELIIAVDQLKNGKQPGSDDVPSEFWKANSLPGSNACDWMLFFFQTICERKQVPTSWHLARITAIFKYGDASQCSNYRPISFLKTRYKLFAAILINKLKLAGIESLLCAAQF